MSGLITTSTISRVLRTTSSRDLGEATCQQILRIGRKNLCKKVEEEVTKQGIVVSEQMREKLKTVVEKLVAKAVENKRFYTTRYQLRGTDYDFGDYEPSITLSFPKDDGGLSEVSFWISQITFYPDGDIWVAAMAFQASMEKALFIS